ncbi:MAG: SRPBCC family protein [Oscillochloris sp.]|nr:SRPBCC family protein [Oscillochloris sp.]
MAATSTRLTQHINAPRAAVYRALVDAYAVASWMVPDDMTSYVHLFEPREGGAFRISLTYDAPTGIGKTTAHTDTYHGRFIRLAPGDQVVEVLEFETDDDAMRGEMTVTFTLRDADGGTEVLAVHENLPPGLSPSDNELGWRMSLEKLARLVEADQQTPGPRR